MTIGTAIFLAFIIVFVFMNEPLLQAIGWILQGLCDLLIGALRRIRVAAPGWLQSLRDWANRLATRTAQAAGQVRDGAYKLIKALVIYEIGAIALLLYSVSKGATMWTGVYAYLVLLPLILVSLFSYRVRRIFNRRASRGVLLGFHSLMMLTLIGLLLCKAVFPELLQAAGTMLRERRITVSRLTAAHNPDAEITVVLAKYRPVPVLDENESSVLKMLEPGQDPWQMPRVRGGKPGDQKSGEALMIDVVYPTKPALGFVESNLTAGKVENTPLVEFVPLSKLPLTPLRTPPPTTGGSGGASGGPSLPTVEDVKKWSWAEQNCFWGSLRGDPGYSTCSYPGRH